jgi:parallel beta-helix repeat protein
MVSISGPLGRAAAHRATRRPPNRRAQGRTAAIAGFAVTGLLAVGAGPAAASPVSCGDTITTSATLHDDLTNCPGNGLVIDADNITLDLNGHTIDGDATPGASQPDAGIRLAGHHGVTLIGGTVQEFDTGVLLDAAPSNRLRRLTVLHNAPGRGIDLENHSDANDIRANTSASNTRAAIVMVDSDRNLVRDNTTRDSPAGGIVGHTASDNRIEHNLSTAGVDEGSNDNLIAHNTATGNPDVGIFAQGDRNIVEFNHVAENGDDIIFSGDHNIIVGNLVTDALGCDGGCGAGIAAEGGTDNLITANTINRTILEGIRVNEFEGAGGPPTIGTVVRANLVRGAGTDGIAVATSTDPASIGGTVKDTLVNRNVVIQAAHDGINVATAATTLSRNLALRNGNLGIEAVAGVIDGGGNHAFGNGNPAQCINIAC